MPTCKKVQNPCKICLLNVTEKNGIRCDGRCKTWMHFECLNYTPGRIKDIRAGFIKVSCPCPDCKTPYPKEHRVDTPFSCSSLKCPANQQPYCNEDCPQTDCAKPICQSPSPHAIPCQPKKKGKHSPCLPNSKTAGCSGGQGSSSSIFGKHKPQIKQTTCGGRRCSSHRGSLKHRLWNKSRPMSPCGSHEQCVPTTCDKAHYGSPCGSRRGSGEFMQPTQIVVYEPSRLDILCSAVNQLTDQMDELMCRMKLLLQEPNFRRKLKKSCHCPGNPN